MVQRHKKSFYPGRAGEWRAVRGRRTSGAPAQREKPKLEIVLKCDSLGSREAVIKALGEIALPDVEISISHSGIGAVTKSDVFLAETDSRLIIGFAVGVMPEIEKMIKGHGVEVRIYNVIYTLTNDIRRIAESLIPAMPEEQTLGSAKVIALFKSGRKGIILGCEVLDGSLAVSEHFRIITAMGPIYSGTIESLHIGVAAIQKASKGQQVGIKIKDFSKAKIGDFVETFRSVPQKKARLWQPTGRVMVV